MENKEELELLRQYFKNDNEPGCIGQNTKLEERILEIQKQNKLKDRIENFRIFLSGVSYRKKEFNEILKELGYEC